jgi:hypothetical protein
MTTSSTRLLVVDNLWRYPEFGRARAVDRRGEDGGRHEFEELHCRGGCMFERVDPTTATVLALLRCVEHYEGSEGEGDRQLSLTMQLPNSVVA